MDSLPGLDQGEEGQSEETRCLAPCARHRVCCVCMYTHMHIHVHNYMHVNTKYFNAYLCQALC